MSEPIAPNPISVAARLEILEQELETVRWLTSKASDDERRAAASVRVLELQKEIESLKPAA